MELGTGNDLPPTPVLNTSEPWLLQPELEGMEIPLALVRRIARDLAAPVSVQFSPPGLFVFEDDSGTGVVQVSMDVHLETDDREATATFRRAFY